MLRKLLNKLEGRLSRYAVPHVTEALVASQAIAFLLIGTQGPDFAERMVLTRDGLLNGEVWRLVSFLLIPPSGNVLFLFFALYLFYLMGTALDKFWGTFRYNVYLLIAWASTVGAVFLVPEGAMTNMFIETSVFLAFAWLYPDFQLMLFFIIPVRIKWLALLTWIFMGIAVFLGDLSTQLSVAAGVLNFLLFFARDIWQWAMSGKKSMERRAETFANKNEAFHRCTICGITDKTHPHAEFRYCPECAGAPCYCMDHIDSHEHRRNGVDAAAVRS